MRGWGVRSEEWAIIASLLIEVQCRSRPRWLIQPGARRSADSQLLITAIVSTCTGKFSKPYTYTYFCLSLPNLTVLTSVWYRFTKYKQYFYHSISSIAKIGLCAICLDIIFLVNSWTLVGATYESHPWSLTPVRKAFRKIDPFRYLLFYEYDLWVHVFADRPLLKSLKTKTMRYLNN